MTRIISPREDVKLLVVSVPEDAHSFELYDNNVVGGKCIMYLRGEPDYACEYTPNLPPGEYFPLGIATELPEEVTRELVRIVDYDVPPSPGNDFQGDWRSAYMDYESEEETGISEFPFVLESRESFASFLRREGITERVFVLKVKN